MLTRARANQLLTINVRGPNSRTIPVTVQGRCDIASVIDIVMKSYGPGTPRDMLDPWPLPWAYFDYLGQPVDLTAPVDSLRPLCVIQTMREFKWSKITGRDGLRDIRHKFLRGWTPI
jgi:hypothetical protein